MARFSVPQSPATAQRIGFLLTPGFSNLTLAAGMEPLRAANRLAGRSLYELVVLSADGGPVPSSTGLRIPADGPLEPATDLAMLFVVSSYGVARGYAPATFRHLRRLADRGCLLGGFETGAYVLAKAGLLDGYKATTHWEDMEDFAHAFPGVEMVNARYVIDRGRATTGGAVPTLDLAINLIRRQFGLPLALDLASTFVYEQDSSPKEAQRIVSLGAFRWQEPALAQAMDLMQAHIEDPLSIREIASRVGIGARTLQLKYRAVTGLSPVSYYQWLRLGAAKRLLERTDLGIAEVAAATGFQNRSAFSRAFKTQFGQSPRAYVKGP